MDTKSLVVTHTHKRSIKFRFPGSAAGGCYRFEPGLPKPSFHPLTTAKGHVVTGFECSDHMWHRGLWFTIKYVNGTNFWEENAPFGVQVSASEPQAEITGPRSLSIKHAVKWTSEATGAVIDEARTLLLSATDEDMIVIDWASDLTALVDLVLDRTPYTTWGGYSGLTFRAGRELHYAEYLLANGEKKHPVIGEPHPWAALMARVDGGWEEFVSVAMLDHPVNPRSPSPWYAKADPHYVFFNAAFLFHEPLKVAKGETLRFRYRVLIRDGLFTQETLGWAAEDYRAVEA
jgi:hypothetical protein